MQKKKNLIQTEEIKTCHNPSGFSAERDQNTLGFHLHDFRHISEYHIGKKKKSDGNTKKTPHKKLLCKCFLTYVKKE